MTTSATTLATAIVDEFVAKGSAARWKAAIERNREAVTQYETIIAALLARHVLFTWHCPPAFDVERTTSGVTVTPPASKREENLLVTFADAVCGHFKLQAMVHDDDTIAVIEAADIPRARINRVNNTSIVTLATIFADIQNDPYADLARAYTSHPPARYVMADGSAAQIDMLPFKLAITKRCMSDAAFADAFASALKARPTT